MDAFYQMEDRPGLRAEVLEEGRFAYLDLPEIQDRLLRFREADYARVTFKLPAIHCSSCIWLLENLHRIHPGVRNSSVNFTRKQADILFDTSLISLRMLVELLVKLGYTPEINLATFGEETPRVSRSLIFKIGVAGFCFGNIMLLSLPEYLGMGEGFESYARFFGWLNILLALPVFFYAANGYYRSAFAAIRSGQVNIDVPITLGIMALFGRSLFEIISHTGAGYMDSLAGLIFFLLIGKWFQEKTYQSLAFDRSYESYFPVAARVILDGKEVQVPLRNLEPGMEILVRNRELIPADAKLLSSEATIDFSFVTGESQPVYKRHGDLIYAGGRQSGTAVRLRVEKKVDQGYLTGLWNQRVFSKEEDPRIVALINKVSRHFTAAVLLIALGGGLFWMWFAPAQAVQVVTAVLIVACPCALALAAPFSFGHASRILGRQLFYLRNAETNEKISAVTDVVFDKTGTLTRNDRFEVEFIGSAPGAVYSTYVAALVSQSNHPLSRAILKFLDCRPADGLSRYREVPGGGLQGMVDGKWIVLGSEIFVTGDVLSKDGATRVFLKVNDELLGYFSLQVAYRDNFEKTLQELSKQYSLHLLSGDQDHEFNHLSAFIAPEQMHFKQSPHDKLKYVENLRSKNKVVMMLGDGLNDAGALKAADVGVAVADNVYDFTPACDAIFNGKAFDKLPELIKLAVESMNVVKAAIFLSFLYNVIGLSFALSGLMSPLVAAILMPVSSISVVILTTVMVNWKARNLGLRAFENDSESWHEKN